jgi:hypothetical protein
MTAANSPAFKELVTAALPITQTILDEVAPKLKIGVRMLRKTVRVDAREGDIGLEEFTPTINICHPC